jgi:hypothetical protein
MNDISSMMWRAERFNSIVVFSMYDLAMNLHPGQACVFVFRMAKRRSFQVTIHVIVSVFVLKDR